MEMKICQSLLHLIDGCLELRRENYSRSYSRNVFQNMKLYSKFAVVIGRLAAGDNPFAVLGIQRIIISLDSGPHHPPDALLYRWSSLY